MKINASCFEATPMKLTALALGLCAAFAQTANAQSAQGASVQATARSYRFDVPAGTLATTVKAIAQVTGKRIEHDDAVGSVKTAAVKGDLTLEAALEMALASAGLTVRTMDNGVLQVAAASQVQAVVIRAKRDQAETSFKADRSDTATRSGTNLMELPGSMTILTSRVLETQQVTSVQQALGNVSGVTFSESTQGKPTLSIRGFALTTTAVNGVTDSSAALTNVFGVERIEVLKGPQSILAGSDALGGTVNVVTKKPQAEKVGSLLMQVGTHRDLTVAGDVGGALTGDKKLSYRLIASRSDAKTSEGGFNGREDTFALPQLRWKDEATDLIVGVSYGKQREPLRKYTVVRRDGVIMPAPEVVMGHPSDGFDSEQKRYFYQLEQSLSPALTLVSRLQRSNSDLALHLHNSSGLSYSAGAPPSSPNGRISFFGNHTHLEDSQTSGDHYLRIVTATGPVHHKVSVGFNHQSWDSKQTSWPTPSKLNVPIYPPTGPVTFDPILETDATPSNIFTTKTTQAGYFVQDLMAWGDWSLLVNLRRTKYTSEAVSTFTLPDGTADTAVEPKQDRKSFTPGVGLVYSLNPTTSLYTSYTEGFSPQFFPRCGGGVVEPMLSRNREVGVKFDLFDSRLSVTTAAFELQQSNTLRYDSTGSCADMMDAQITKGFEVDLQGRVATGWNAVLNYTFNKLKDEGNPARIFTGQPKNKVSVWTTYEFQSEGLKGLGIGAGITAQSRTNGEFRSRFAYTVPGQAQTDISVSYKTGKWSSVFGVKNVFDRTLYGPANTNLYLPYLPGRQFTLTVKRDFN